MNNIPICKICGKEAVQANAGVYSQIFYWYCRNCKIEVDNYGYKIDVKKDGQSPQTNSFWDKQIELEEFFTDFDTDFNK